jgi:hypothetical protein
VSLRRACADVERKIEGILRAIEDGMYGPAMKERMASLEGRRQELRQQIEAAPPAPTVRLHPGLSEIYRRKVMHLAEALDDEDIKAEATEIIRGLIDKIVLTPESAGIKAELHGDLAEILALCEAADPKQERPSPDGPGRQLSVVAGARNHLYRTWLVWARARSCK